MRAIVLFLLLFSLIQSFAQRQIVLEDRLAFPGALGFGKNTEGGRGGDVYHVTTLNGYGEGSLREGIETAAGPRIIVFDVSGNISLTQDPSNQNTQIKINADESNISILGQTAPAGGITLKDANFFVRDVRNIILRHFRIRPGKNWTANNNNTDAITLAPFQNQTVSNIIFDHLSVSWGKDGVFDIGGKDPSTISNVSITNCFFYENIATGYAALFSPTSERSGQGSSSNFSIIGNCFANCVDRSPNFSTYAETEHMNNLAYYGKRVSSVRGATALDYVGNVNIENPSDPRVSGGTLTRNTSDQTNYPGYPSIYMEDNIDTHESDNVATVRADTESLLVNSRQVSSGYVPIPASEVHQYIKDNVGANLYRDAADTRVLNDIENLTGGRIFGEDEVGGFPVIPENTRGNNFYAGSSHISQAFYDEHNLSGDGTSVTINWDFGTYQVINNAGYTDREIYWAWLANDFENLEGNEIPASFLINEIPQEVTSYSSQDNGGFEVMDSGTTLKLTGNSWKKVPLQYTITPNTLLEFEFKVDGTGEIHGIGFDDDTSLNTSGSPDELFFKLFGTQDVTWDNNDFENYTTGDGWKSYSIPVGEYITGDKKYLVFVGDKDSNSSSQNSSFRIVSLREENTTNCPNTPYELTASDSDGSNVPCNLVDDDLGTRWGANGDGEWVMFDLGSVQEVNQIQIAFHRGDLRTAFFDVQVSDDAVTWTDVYGSQQQSSGTTLQLQDFDFPLQNARYVRYLGHGNSENAWNSLLEMRVNRTVANCPGSPYGISASGSDGSNVPCNLVDDDLGTRWGANGDGEWVMFDLGSVQEVNQIQVAFYRGDLRTAFFDVQVSDDAVTWSDVYGSQQQSSGTTLQLQDFDFPLQNARYVRYLGHGNSENAWNSLLEMRVNRTVDPQELILQPIQDAYLQGSTRYNNNLLRVNQGSRIAYLKYDLSSINGEITDAKLHFRVASDTGSGIAEVHKASNTNWTETNLGDSNKPSETALWGTTTDLGQTSADVVVSLSTDRFFGGGALSLIVKHVGSNDFALASKENTTFPAPRLVLTYRPTSSLRAKIMNTKLPYSDLIMLYPNPTTKMVNIMGITGRKNILIMDFSGKVLHREASTTLEPSLDLSRYAPGTYYISVSGNVENKTFKVIKK